MHRKAIRSAMSRWVSSFSRPSAMNDWPEAVISSMSLRRMTSSLPSWRRRVTELAVSLATRPVIRRPSFVATV